MRFQNILFILLISIIFTGCGSCESKPKVNGSKSTPIPKASVKPSENQTPVSDSNKDENTQKPKLDDPAKVPEKEEKIEAVTLKPVIEAYCAAMRNGDNVSLEKVYSKKALAEMKKEMQQEGTATLHDYLESERVGNKCQLVNEEIQGNTAKAEVITETYEDGTYFKFVKENNEWKMTNESEEIDRVDN